MKQTPPHLPPHESSYLLPKTIIRRREHLPFSLLNRSPKTPKLQNQSTISLASPHEKPTAVAGTITTLPTSPTSAQLLPHSFLFFKTRQRSLGSTLPAASNLTTCSSVGRIDDLETTVLSSFNQQRVQSRGLQTQTTLPSKLLNLNTSSSSKSYISHQSKGDSIERSPKAQQYNNSIKVEPSLRSVPEHFPNRHPSLVTPISNSPKTHQKPQIDRSNIPLSDLLTSKSRSERLIIKVLPNISLQTPKQQTSEQTHYSSLIHSTQSPASAVAAAAAPNLKVPGPSGVVSQSLALRFKKKLLDGKKTRAITQAARQLDEEVEKLMKNMQQVHREYENPRKVTQLVYPLVQYTPTLLRMIFHIKPQEKTYLIDEQNEKLSNTFGGHDVTLHDSLDLRVLKMPSKYEDEDMKHRRIASEISSLNEKLSAIIEARVQKRLEQLTCKIIDEHLSVQVLESTLTKNIEKRTHIYSPQRTHSSRASITREILLAKHNYKPVERYAFQPVMTASSNGSSQKNFPMASNTLNRESARLGDFTAIDKQTIAISNHLDGFLDRILLSTSFNNNNSMPTKTLLPTMGDHSHHHPSRKLAQITAQSSPKNLHSPKTRVVINTQTK